MLYVYLFALVFGGVLLGASIFFGDGHDRHAGDMSDPAHLDHGSIEGFASIVGSLRFWTFFCFFFGAPGAAMTHFGLANTLVTAISSASFGLVVGVAVQAVFRYAARSQVVGVGTLQSLIGLEGEVVVSVSAAKPGKVRLSTTTGLRDALAQAANAADLEVGARVQVIDVRDHLLQVVRVDSET